MDYEPRSARLEKLAAEFRATIDALNTPAFSIPASEILGPRKKRLTLRQRAVALRLRKRRLAQHSEHGEIGRKVPPSRRSLP